MLAHENKTLSYCFLWNTDVVWRVTYEHTPIMTPRIFNAILNVLFKPNRLPAEVKTAIHTPPSKRVLDPLAALGPLVDADEHVGFTQHPFESAIQRTIEDFPIEEDYVDIIDEHEKPTGNVRFVGDAAVRKAVERVGDSVTGQGTESLKGSWSAYQVPDSLQNWFNAQGFIGYQACALIAQHWLIDKACTMPGEDAVRNGYEVSLVDEGDENLGEAEEKNDTQGEDLIQRLTEIDKEYEIKDHLVQFWRYINIYGIRVCVFDIESDDPKYYEKPFNIDGVGKGTYKGIKQVDPYWMMPVLTGQDTVDPTSRHFYEPTFWTIGGKKYHKSHLIIGRGPMPADILKPNYIFGGIPLTQRMYERAFAAERTANEGPLLAMTKRTNVLHMDLKQAEAQPGKFMARLLKWVNLRDNFGVKTVGINEVVEQFDTSLADLDTVIMTQYQLVAAISQVPSTKLLGTSPKGFGTEGTHEENSYHERLETVQMIIQPLLDRHHMLSIKSEFGENIPVQAIWNRVGSMTAQELADLNAKKMEAGEKAINLGVISPDEERQRLKSDPLSGYNHLGDEEASSEMGQTPENEAKLTTANARVDQAKAKEQGIGMPSAGGGGSQKPPQSSTTTEGSEDAGGIGGATPNNVPFNGQSSVKAHVELLRNALQRNSGGSDLQNAIEGLRSALANHNTDDSNADGPGIKDLLRQLDALINPHRTTGSTDRSLAPGTEPGTRRLFSMIADGSSAGLPEQGGKEFSARKMPKIKVGRLTILVENPKGSIRAGRTLAGEDWRSQMPHHYGFINGVIGADGDELDAFVGPNLTSRRVYVINQIEPTTGDFDEHKVMLGFDDDDSALECYEQAYQEGWKGFDSMYEMSMQEFYDWIRNGDLMEPASKINSPA